MKIFAKYKIRIKDFIKKIVVICTLITSLATVTPKPVEAGIGGTLLQPICDLLVGLGDGIVKITHNLILRQQTTLIRVDLNGDGTKFLRGLLTVTAFVVIAAAVIATGGAAILAIGAGTLATISMAGTVLAVAIGGGIYVGAAVYGADAWDNSDELALPLYTLSPDNIFKNKIPLFSVNFFNVNDEKMDFSNFSKADVTNYKSLSYTNELTSWSVVTQENIPSEYSEIVSKIRSNGVSEPDTTLSAPVEGSYTYYLEGTTAYRLYRYYDGVGETKYTLHSANAGNANSDDFNKTEMETSVYGFTHELQGTVAKWYGILRIIAIVGMMTVLVYIGIRILISSTSSQKAKHKELLGDWLIGMTLLFTMHYIMIFSNMAVDKITEIFASMNPHAQASIINLNDSDNKKDKRKKLENELKQYGIAISDNPNVSLKDNMAVYVDGDNNLEWHTDLMGNVRIKTNAFKVVDEAYIGYTIMFWVMIFYMLLFTWTYIKRVIYMAFLTMISPLVALTYPIDKINDGKAQGFDFWFKEYIFNLLLQPMHLLIYTLLISGALELSSTNWIYSLVALGFIASAEKIVRQMFNFSKASTPGTFMGPAGAALTMTGMRWLFGHGPKGKGLGDEKEKSGGKSDADNADYKESPKGIGDNLKGLIRGKGKNNDDGDSGQVPGQTILDGFAQSTEQSLLDGFGNDEESTLLNGFSDDDMQVPGQTRLNLPGMQEQRESSLGINSAENNDGIGSRWSRIKLGAKNVGSLYTKGMKRKLTRSFKEGKPIRSLGRLSAGLAAGTVFGGIGLASGIASGDVSKTAQIAGAAGVGGYKLGRESFDSTSQTLNVEGVEQEIKKAQLGQEEYKRQMIEARKKKIIESENTIKMIQEKLKITDRTKAEERAKEMVNAYSKAGIDADNIGEMIKLDKFIDAHKDSYSDSSGKIRPLTREEAAQASRINKRYNVGGTHDPTKVTKGIETMAKDLEKYGVGVKDAEKFWNMARDYDNFTTIE